MKARQQAAKPGNVPRIEAKAVQPCFHPRQDLPVTEQGRISGQIAESWPINKQWLCNNGLDTQTVRHIYDQNAHRVRRSLRALGVAGTDVSDATQEVFLAVYKKLGQFQGRSQLSTWIFGICLRVASNWRRRAHRRYEICVEPEFLDLESPNADAFLPSRRLSSVEARNILAQIPAEQLATLLFFELEGMRCEDIAATDGVPLGTVFSRLRLARSALRRALARAQRNEIHSYPGRLGRKLPPRSRMRAVQNASARRHERIFVT